MEKNEPNEKKQTEKLTDEQLEKVTGGTIAFNYLSDGENPSNREEYCKKHPQDRICL